MIIGIRYMSRQFKSCVSLLCETCNFHGKCWNPFAVFAIFNEYLEFPRTLIIRHIKTLIGSAVAQWNSA